MTNHVMIYSHIYTVSVCCHNEAPHTVWLKQHTFIVSQSGGWKSKIWYWQDRFLLKAERESVPCLSPSFWWFAGNLWHSLAYRSTTLVSAFVFTLSSPYACLQIFPFHTVISHIGLRPTLMTLS